MIVLVISRWLKRRKIKTICDGLWQREIDRRRIFDSEPSRAENAVASALEWLVSEVHFSTLSISRRPKRIVKRKVYVIVWSKLYSSRGFEANSMKMLFSLVVGRVKWLYSGKMFSKEFGVDIYILWSEKVTPVHRMARGGHGWSGTRIKCGKNQHVVGSWRYQWLEEYFQTSPDHLEGCMIPKECRNPHLLC